VPLINTPLFDNPPGMVIPNTITGIFYNPNERFFAENWQKNHVRGKKNAKNE
jgi:hypothetical protein